MRENEMIFSFTQPSPFPLRDHERMKFLCQLKKNEENDNIFSRCQRFSIVYFKPFGRTYMFAIFTFLYYTYILIGFLFDTTRYAYSDDSEEFDKDITLTLIKPSPLPTKDVRIPFEVRSTPGGDGTSNGGDVEEDKTE